MQQHCPIVRPYHVICCWQHVTRNTICKFVWKLSDSAWGHQCETKRSKQNTTMCSVHAVRRMCFANGEEHASTLAMARQRARDRKIQMPNGRQRAPDAVHSCASAMPSQLRRGAGPWDEPKPVAQASYAHTTGKEGRYGERGRQRIFAGAQLE